MEWITVENAIKTEIETETRTDKKEWASSVGSCQKHKPQHPHHVKVSPRRRRTPTTTTQQQNNKSSNNNVSNNLSFIHQLVNLGLGSESSPENRTRSFLYAIGSFLDLALERFAGDSHKRLRPSQPHCFQRWERRSGEPNQKTASWGERDQGH